MLAVLGDQLDALDAIEAGVEADAFVDVVGVGRVVGAGDLQRNDLVLEFAALRRGNRALVALIGIGVELLLGEPILLRHHFRAGELAEHDVRIFLLDARALVMTKTVLGRQLRGEAHRHPRHRFHAGGNHDVHRAGHHGLRREVQRLLRRTALAVDRGGGHAFRQLRGHHRVAGDVVGLLAGLHHAAHDDVFDLGGIDARAIDQRIQHGSGEIGRMPACETSPLAAARGACGGDDIGLGHVCSP